MRTLHQMMNRDSIVSHDESSFFERCFMFHKFHQCLYESSSSLYFWNQVSSYNDILATGSLVPNIQGTERSGKDWNAPTPSSSWIQRLMAIHSQSTKKAIILMVTGILGGKPMRIFHDLWCLKIRVNLPFVQMFVQFFVRNQLVCLCPYAHCSRVG